LVSLGFLGGKISKAKTVVLSNGSPAVRFIRLVPQLHARCHRVYYTKFCTAIWGCLAITKK